MKASEASRPAVTVKVDDSPDGRPPGGVDAADVVLEEKVEGTVTRLLAVFHSKDSENVGPIRSVRSTDPPLLTPIGGVFVYSGGIPAFVNEVKKAGVTAISELENGGAFKLRSDRKRPYKTYGSTAKFRTFADDKATAPAPMFTFHPPKESFTAAGELPATSATLVFGARTTTAWAYDAATKVWKRSLNGTAHTVEGGGQLSAANVVILFVPYRATGFRDPSGTQVDKAAVVGTGEGVVLSEGKQVPIKWTKSSEAAVTTYTDSAGTALKMKPGSTWIALPPVGASLTII